MWDVGVMGYAVAVYRSMPKLSQCDDANGAVVLCKAHSVLIEIPK
jgi:hypothetical protein